MGIHIKAFVHILGTILAFSPLIAVIFIGIWLDKGVPLHKAYNHMCDNNVSYENKEYAMYCSERNYDKQFGLEK